MTRTLGEALAEAATQRKASGVSWADQARAAGVRADVIRDIVRGKSDWPTPANARRLAQYYRVDLSAFPDYAGMAEAPAPPIARRAPVNVPVLAMRDGLIEISGTFDREGLARLIQRLQLLHAAMGD